jgi:hypothetical protein
MFNVYQHMMSCECNCLSKWLSKLQQVLVGDLPPDFLRVPNSSEQRQIAADHQQAAILQTGGMSVFSPTASRLSITVVQVDHVS